MNILNRNTRVLLISLSIIALYACGGGGGGGSDSPKDNGPAKVAAITIPNQSAFISVGESLQLTAAIAPADAVNKDIIWVSSDSSAISVSTTGLVTTSVDSGSVTITAIAQDGSQVRGSTTVTAILPCSTTIACLRVTSDTSANGDGSNWANPISGLQAALDQAKTLLAQTNNNPNTVRILLQNGIYRPSEKADGTACAVGNPDCTFVMQNNVEIYGGFAGTENSLVDRVLSTATATILDGLLNPSDTVTACSTDTMNLNCSETVVTNDYSNMPPLTSSAVLDGVLIRNARNQYSFGGGMFNSNASPTIRNVTFSGNYAAVGGGMYNVSASPTIRNVTFLGNYALLYGAGMANVNKASPQLANVTFSGNSAADSGGGMYNHTSSPVIINGTFSENYAINGGGVLNDGKTPSSPLFINTTFLGNVAKSVGDGNNVLTYANADPIFINTLMWGDGGIQSVAVNVYFSLIKDQGLDPQGYPTKGNLDGIAASADGVFGGAALADNGNPFARTISIATNSPAVNNGALVWKSGQDYYASRDNLIYKVTGDNKGSVDALPADATLVSSGGANNNSKVTPTAGSAVYPDIGSYQD